MALEASEDDAADLAARLRFLCDLLGDDVVAKSDALVADVDGRPGDQLLHLALILSAEGASQLDVLFLLHAPSTDPRRPKPSGDGCLSHAAATRRVGLQAPPARATHRHSRMLRIRIGRRWTRERGTAPHDSVSLELDGVALVDGAEDEPLLPLVESILGSTGALARGTPMADVSLPESGLVLCLENT